MRTPDPATCPTTRQLPAAPASGSATPAGSGHGDGGWTAPVPPSRLEYLLLADPMRGWLVDDLLTEPLPTPAATPTPTSSR